MADPIILNSEGDLYSLGKLSELIQRPPTHVIFAASKLELKPLSIDLVPFFNGSQAEAIREWLDTHNVRQTSDAPEAEVRR